MATSKITNPAMMVESGYLAKVSSKISSYEFASYIKVGRVCIVRINFTVDSTISDATETLFNGAPASAVLVRTTFTRTNAKNTDYARIGIDSGGAIRNQYTSSGIAAGLYEGEIVYITAE